MGISGHMLGPRKLRRLQRACGLPLFRAYIRNHYCEGVVQQDEFSTCRHFEIDPVTGAYREIEYPIHWASCPTVRDGDT